MELGPLELLFVGGPVEITNVTVFDWSFSTEESEIRFNNSEINLDLSKSL